jgi:hypothetical protein
MISCLAVRSETPAPSFSPHGSGGTFLAGHPGDAMGHFPRGTASANAVQPDLSGKLLHRRRPEAQRQEPVEPEDRMLAATEAHQRRLQRRLVVKHPAFSANTTNLPQYP